MNSRWKKMPWKGFTVLIVVLAGVSVVAYLLSSIEGFAAGVIVVFIGWLVSFFRDDIKQSLGLTGKAKNPEPAVITSEEYLWKLDKTIAKGRTKVEKTATWFSSEARPYKRSKIAREAIEQATRLLATIDQAKSCAIQAGQLELLQHYEDIAQDIRQIRERYQLLATYQSADEGESKEDSSQSKH